MVRELAIPLSSLCLIAILARARATSGYKVSETPGGLELTTPYGTKTIIGDYGSDGSQNYRIAIPIDELKPSPPPSPTPAPTPDGTSAQASPSPNAVAAQKPEADSSDRLPASLEPTPAPGEAAVTLDDTDTLVVEANHLYNEGRFYDATTVVDEILRKNPAFVRGWIMKGSLLHVEGQKDLARKAWEKAKALDPKNGEIEAIIERYQ